MALIRTNRPGPRPANRPGSPGLAARARLGSAFADRRANRPWDAVSWWYSLIFVVPALFLLGRFVVGGASPPATLTVRVTDGYTQQPLAGAVVNVGDRSATSDAQGDAEVRRPAGPAPVSVHLPDYAPAATGWDPAAGDTLAVPLRPTVLRGVLRDRDTGQPIPGAAVAVLADGADGPATTTDAAGAFVLTELPVDARLRVEAGDYGVIEEAVGPRTQVELAARNTAVAGVVTDAAGEPIAGAVVTAGEARAVTRKDGTYKLVGVPEGAAVTAAAAGFLDAQAPIAADRTAALALERVQIKAVYANGYALADPTVIGELLALIERTELNALVVDIKQDTIYYDSKVEFFQNAEMVQPLYDLDELLAELRERDIYAIARMVVFQDPLVAYAYPELAVRDETTGDLWRNYDGVGWVNAFNEELWDANIELALEAVSRGFAEVQYDYVRFPSDGDLTTADFGQEYTAVARQAAITGFLTRSRDALQPTGAKLAVDIFGYTALVSDEQGIGQNFAEITPLVDYVCMMIYPSHFSEGNIASAPGHPNDYPYETILESLQRAEEQAPGAALKFRPWLQDFSHPVPGLRDYTAEDVRRQIDAAEDFGTSGWMLWNAAIEYSEAALEPA